MVIPEPQKQKPQQAPGQTAQVQVLPGDFLSQPLTFGAVWRETMGMARQHGTAFMFVLLVPVGKILLGLYGSLGFSLMFTNWARQPAQASILQDHRLLVLLAVLIIALSGIALFVNGCWQYVVYWASLCLNVREVMEKRPVDFKAAYQAIARQKKALLTQWVSLIFVFLPLLPCLPPLGLPFLAGLIPQLPPGFVLLSIVAGLLLGGVLGLAWLAMQFLLTYGFQILALEESPRSLWSIVRHSSSLTLRRPWLTLGLQVILFLVTNYVLTIPVNTVIRLSGLSQPLDHLHSWFGSQVVGDYQSIIQQMQLGGLAAQVMTQLQTEKLNLVQGFTDAVVGVVIPLLLLPLGTTAFTLVYLHLRSQCENPVE